MRVIKYIDGLIEVSDTDFEKYNWIAKDSCGEVCLYENVPKELLNSKGYSVGTFRGSDNPSKVIIDAPEYDYYFRAWKHSAKKLEDVAYPEGVFGEWDSVTSWGSKTDKYSFTDLETVGEATISLVLNFTDHTFWYSHKILSLYSGYKFDSIESVKKYLERVLKK